MNEQVRVIFRRFNLFSYFPSEVRNFPQFSSLCSSVFLQIFQLLRVIFIYFLKHIQIQPSENKNREGKYIHKDGIEGKSFQFLVLFLAVTLNTLPTT